MACAEITCRSSKSKNPSLHFHRFPKDPARRVKWTCFVANRKPSFVPNGSSLLCEKHFTANQYGRTQGLAEKIGYKHSVRQYLNSDAVPTIFSSEGNGSTEQTETYEMEMGDDLPEFTATPLIILPAKTTVTVASSISSPTYTSATTKTSTTVTTTANTIKCSPKNALQWFADITAGANRINNSFSIQTQTPYNLVQRKSVGTQSQSRPNLVDKSTQTTTTLVMPPKPILDDSVFSSIASANSSRDPEWVLNSEDEDETEDDIRDIQPVEEKFIVYRSKIEELLKECTICGRQCELKNRVIGTCVTYNTVCQQCGTIKDWASQPFTGKMPYGNLILSAAILFAGASPMRCLRMIEFAGIAGINIKTFNNIQTAYLTPAIRSVWQQKQVDLIQQRKDKPLRLGGDGRCCSPGHTAKYCSYSLMDLETGHVLDTQLIQSNEVANSYGMEKEGLIRCLKNLTDEHNLTISHLVTDRHSAVKKYMRETWPSIQHWFDVWHMAKGVHKKLVSAGKKKLCEKTGNWARSISNHMYWCAASSNGDGELVKEKWLSIMNHVIDIHDGHGEKFPACAHGDLEQERDWMVKDRKPYQELEKVVTNKLLLTDIQKLSPAEQTSSLEAFHKVVIGFAPKSAHYFHAQMEARLYLAILHFNANQQRPQKRNSSGEGQYRISYPKGRTGGVAKEVKTDMNFDYVTDLMEEVLLLRDVNESYRSANRARLLEEPRRPGPICQSTPKQNKRSIIEQHVRRFNR